MLYVHMDQVKKPYLDDVSTEKKDGYTEINANALMSNQLIAVMKYPQTCYLDESGALHAPTDLPISDEEKQAQMVADLRQQLAASHNINAILLGKLNALGQNVDTLMQQMKGDK